MDSQQQRNFLGYSLLLHVTVLMVLAVNFEFNANMPVMESSNKETVVNATVIGALPVPIVSHAVQPSVPPPPVIAHPKLHKTEQLVLSAPPRKQTIALGDKKQKKLRPDLVQKQLLADLKVQTEQQKKIKQKTVQEAFAKEIRQLKLESLQQQMLREQQRVAGEKAQQMRGEVNKYKALILQMISQHWLVPHNVDKKLTAELLIRLAPGGMVLEVQLIKSSGNEALDRSARAAVFRASPLPVPASSDEFEAFKQFVLKVRPENVLSDDHWMG
jgi:colicin import membrane protein